MGGRENWVRESLLPDLYARYQARDKRYSSIPVSERQAYLLGCAISTASASLMIRRAPQAAQLTDKAQAMMKKIEDCLHCGKCKAKCPYGLDTPRLLEENYQDYREILAGKMI